jgi:uncharacterized protein YqjF (DUF2071 family)
MDAGLPTARPTEHIRRPAMLQSWCSLSFLHWRYPVEALRPHVPEPLEIETFDGSAWVAVAPFVIRDLRPAWLPAAPWISQFPETNCRTYVRAPDGRSGVWFFSLDAARAAAVAGARLTFGLPYCWARMRVAISPDRVTYESSRRWPDTLGRTKIVVEPREPIDPSPLEIFLTARFRLYSFMRGRLVYAGVEHPPWPLQHARLIEAHQTLTDCAGLPPPEGAPLVHFSSRVDVRVGRPRIVQLRRPALPGSSF